MRLVPDTGDRPAARHDEHRTDVDPIAEGLSAVLRRLEPGERLPSERALAARPGVSRTALRDRLQHAEALGVLRRTVGSGTYVERMNPHGFAVGLQLAIDASQLSLSSLHPVRVGLERQAARNAASSHDAQAVEDMNGAIAAMRRTAVTGDMTAMAEADAAFHRALMDSPGNVAMSFFGQAMAKVRLDAMRRRTEQLRLVTRDPLFIVDLHADIHAAIVAGDPDKAARRVEAHFAEFTQAVIEIGQHPYAE